MSKALSSRYFHMLADKKPKKVTQKSTPSGDSSSLSSRNTQPQRVTNQINIPVRQQIAWAKAYKRLMAEKTGGTSHSSTKRFRRERGPKEVEEEAVEIDYVNTKPPAVFVDGYNIIGYINKEEGRCNIDLEDARDCLIGDLSILCGATGWWIEVVFDAYMSASSVGGSKTSLVDNVLVTFTSASETADNYIERRFSELARDGFTNMVVATDDNVLRMVAGSAGAGFLSAGMLLEEFRIALRGWETVQEEMEIESKRKGRNGVGVSDDMKLIIEQMKAEAAIRSSEADALRRKKSEDIKLEKQMRKKNVSPRPEVNATSSPQLETTKSQPSSPTQVVASHMNGKQKKSDSNSITTTSGYQNKAKNAKTINDNDNGDDDSALASKFEELLKTGTLRLR